jgi:hypothetical protein
MKMEATPNKRLITRKTIKEREAFQHNPRRSVQVKKKQVVAIKRDQ